MYLENMTYPFTWEKSAGKGLMNPVLRGAFHPTSFDDWSQEAGQEDESPHKLETSYFRKLRLVMHDAVDRGRRG